MHPIRRNQLTISTQHGRRTQFGYEGVETSPHRRAPRTTVKGEDIELSRQKRKIGTATVRDEARSAALLTWMIRRHLDYTSRFEIGFRSDSEALDNEVLSFLAWHRRRQNWDIGGRHNRDQWMRIFEANKALAGDAFGIKVNGGKMQGIDSEQIAKPDDWGGVANNKELIASVSDHGLILDRYNGVTSYCVCTIDKNGRRVFDHIEDAINVVTDGYYGASFNQTRGISPILAAINDVIDQRDIVLYTKINLKLKNLFGIAIFRDDSGQISNAEEGTQAEWTPDRVNVLDLDINDKVQSVESANTPSANALDFMGLLARITLTALDIPYSSFDSDKASFSARIADRAEYEASAESKRQKNADVLREIYAWRLASHYANNPQFQSVVDGSGWTIGQIVESLDPMPACTPWMDRVNEIKADILDVSLGTNSIPRLCRQRGLDAYAIGAEQAEYLAWAKSKELPIFYAAGGQEAVQKIMDETPTGTNGNLPDGQQ